MSATSHQEESKTEAKPKDISKLKQYKLFKKLVSHLPVEQKKKFAALMFIARQRNDIKEQLEKEICDLEREYNAACAPLYKLREELVSGKRDPTPQELANLPKYQGNGAKTLEGIGVQEMERTKGIPGFWLKAFQNHSEMNEFIQPEDIFILKYLTDVRKVQLEGNDYEVVFVFESNDYFTNKELKKTMIMDPEEPGECKETKGTAIAWKEGKDITKVAKTKKQRHKASNATRTIQTFAYTNSFFNYFRSRISSNGFNEEIERSEREIRKDIAFRDDVMISELICEELIPDTLNYYLGIAN